MKKTLLAAMAMVSLCGHAQLLNEGFETWPVSGWTTHSNGGVGITWQQSNGTTTQPAYSGSHAAYLDKENVPNGALAQDWLVSPLVQIPVGNAAVTFASRLTIPGDQGSIYKLMILPATGNPAVLSDYVVLKQWTETELNPVQADYMMKSVTIPPAYAATSAYFAFYMEGDDGDRWLIDDVGLAAACEAPAGVPSMLYGSTSLSFGWAETDGINQWEVEVVPESDAPTGQGVIVNDNSYTDTDIEPGFYKVYIRSLCDDGGVSVWTGPFQANVGYNNQLNGVLKYDSNNDGECDDNNGATLLYNKALSVTMDGGEPFTVYTGLGGHYSIHNIADGEHTFTIEVPPFAGFPGQVFEEQVIFDTMSEWAVTHCLLQPQQFNNLLVNFYTYEVPRPGFDVSYSLKVKNWGNLDSEDVTVTLQFDADRLEFLSAGSSFNGVVSGNTITLTIGDIEALHQASGNIKFHVKQPPVNMGGETVTFTATLSAVDNDIDMTNNTAVYVDGIVNSYDPNEITVHEGAKIKEEQAANYLNYTIHFQNTGTAEAINVTLTNTLDDLLDWDTFEAVDSSHDYEVIRNGNLLEFEYENIFLPDSTANEPGSHGHITYRIKPKAGFGVGDIISNQAGIYFDFNPAIMTNIATTEIIATAGLNDNAHAIARLYPNPVKDQLRVEVAQGELQLVTIHDVNGRLCLSANAGIIDTNALNSGIYFVNVTTDAGSANYKIIKQ